MKGYVDEDFNPRITDIFLVGKKELIPLDVVLDTGFNDEFCLPEKYVDVCELEFSGFTSYILGDGTAIEDDTYEGYILFQNKIRRVKIVLTSDEEALIGMRLLEDKVITIDMKQKSVLISD